MTMTAGALAERLTGARLVGDPCVEVRDLTHDSRHAAPGALFAAIPGLHSDAREFVADALARGASAVLLEPPPIDTAPVQILVPSAREALPRAAEMVYGRPAAGMPVVGITGTNGKTTVAFLVAALLGAAGRKPALVGSLFSRFGTETADAANTTPEADDLHRFWAEARRRGADALVMEASSHGLLLHRVDRIGFQIGVLTNLTRDHLDYHPDLAAYRGAKTRLFALLPRKGTAIVPDDDPAGDVCARATSARVIRYGETAAAHVRAARVEVSAAGIDLDVVAGRRSFSVRSALFGRFNVSNLLAAAAVGEALGLEVDVIARGLGEVRAVPGRAERIDCGQPFVVLNDFAHTPDALMRILSAARELTPGRLHVVFGCGGDRDRGKRPLMGEVAGRLADRITVTSDNPRTEDPQAIIRDIMSALTGRPDVTVEPDREKAFGLALARMEPGDTLVAAGKGHEQYQIVGDRKRRFDDAEVLTQGLRSLGFER
jgi:UDP-N-acetylmuramoyl-L-alanyl-D-glutamate--2,6-diaminopimelate ligase